MMFTKPEECLSKHNIWSTPQLRQLSNAAQRLLLDLCTMGSNTRNTTDLTTWHLPELLQITQTAQQQQLRLISARRHCC
eukprot:1575921-Pyramimonas_sp.AAC.1